MKTTFNYNGLEFTMNARNLGEVSNVWNDNGTRYKYRVTVSTPNGCTRFNFFDSIHNHDKGIQELDRDNLRDALGAFLSDGMAYDYAYNFIEFCDEMGYDSDSRKALSIYNACKRHHEAAARVFGSDYAKIYDEINEE